MKGFRIFGRNVINAVKSIFRNISLSTASIVCTTITLIIVSLAIVCSVNINSFTKDLENNLTIIAFVDEDATKDEIDIIKNKLLEIKNVKSDEILYKDKETVKEETIKNSEDLALILDTWTKDDNFLRSEFFITVNDVSKLETTVNSIKQIDNIVNVKYEEDVVKKVVPIVSVVKKLTVIVILGLIAVTIFLICNTIKLTIFARKTEIEIMRLVGISNFVIKLPFVIEGLFLGILGAVIPIVITIWGYTLVFDKLEGFIYGNFIELVSPMPFTLIVSLILVLIAAVVGMIGSYTTVRK